MSLRTSLKNLIHRDPAASLRERAADRATLKQRAADLKAGLASAAQAAPVSGPVPKAGRTDADPKLVSLVAAWVDVRRRYEAVTQEDQTEEGDALFEQILALQPAIYAFPVASIADLCAKLPVLRNEFEDIAVGPDPANPYWSRQAADAVLRDLASLSDAAASEEDDTPLTTESAASLNFEAVHVPTAIRTPRQWHERFAPHTLRLHMADRVLRMSKRELVAFVRGAGQKDPTLPVSMIKQVEAARAEAQTYAEMLNATWVRLLVAGAAAIPAEEQNSPQAESPSTKPTATPALAAPREPDLVGMIDFASASLDDLQALHDLADLVGGVAYALVWTGRCQGGEATVSITPRAS